jgi:hypothetical protein
VLLLPSLDGLAACCLAMTCHQCTPITTTSPAPTNAACAASGGCGCAGRRVLILLPPPHAPTAAGSSCSSCCRLLLVRLGVRLLERLHKKQHSKHGFFYSEAKAKLKLPTLLSPVYFTRE